MSLSVCWFKRNGVAISVMLLSMLWGGDFNFVYSKSGCFVKGKQVNN